MFAFSNNGPAPLELGRKIFVPRNFRQLAKIIFLAHENHDLAICLGIKIE